MNKNQILLIIFFFTGISSCKKDFIEHPITYASYSITSPDIKIFTKNGEITSSALKNNLIKRHEKYLTELESVDIEGKIIATYISENSVELTIDNTKEQRARTVHEIAELIYWEKKDTSQFVVNPTLNIRNLLKYHPLFYEENNMPQFTGYEKFAKLKECCYVLNSSGKLKIPMLDYFYKHEFGYHSISGINNAFDENSLSNLSTNDTIIIQEYLIEME